MLPLAFTLSKQNLNQWGALEMNNFVFRQYILQLKVSSLGKVGRGNTGLARTPTLTGAFDLLATPDKQNKNDKNSTLLTQKTHS